MGTTLFFVAVGILLLFAIIDLVVGVSNDAVNFLNSSIGSKAAPRMIILAVASLGILAGVMFSSGMMEVARKGIFHPQFFTMPELITIFLAVMLTDVLLLDLFNTYALPTSTTVSIVFDLLGAAVGMAAIKVVSSPEGAMALGDYINTGKAMIIIMGILLSVLVAFFCGALAQFLTRLIFTFDYKPRLKRYGALWGGLAMAVITYFILIKGAKGASFILPETKLWIKNNWLLILAAIFAFSAVFLQILTYLHINILKPIVLTGTFALAMAFAANDLVNFIGVPMAGLHAYTAALATADPLNVTMEALSQKVPTETYLLLIAGMIMVLTIWFSRKARKVTQTEISLGQQHEGLERFESIGISRIIVQMFASLSDNVKQLVPLAVRQKIDQRIDPVVGAKLVDYDGAPSFDLVRASVNLMVASAVISFATSLKLPLSTTYVTFMVAMGSSFSDKAWGRESAVYRVTGVITVIGGWFLTAFIAFTVAFIFANIIHYLGVFGVLLVVVLAVYTIFRSHQQHKTIEQDKEKTEVFNLRKVKDVDGAISTTFEHMALLLREVRESFGVAFDALFKQDVYRLRQERKKVKKIQMWANIIIANIFKVLRLKQKGDGKTAYKYAQTIRRLQKIADGHRDVVTRSYMHIANQHKGLLDVQQAELQEIKKAIIQVLSEVEEHFNRRETVHYQAIIDEYQQLRDMADRFHINQIERIRDDSSKTRLSILFYAIMGNCVMITKQNIKLLEIFNQSFQSKS